MDCIWRNYQMENELMNFADLLHKMVENVKSQKLADFPSFKYAMEFDGGDIDSLN
jgi:hypothetical protein